MSFKTSLETVTPDLAQFRYLFTNVFMYGDSTSWVLIDAGIAGSASDIINAAESRFGEGIAPEAYVLTHGHFDHVGAFPDLFETWDVPIYAHPLEIPFLTGRKDYPEPDPTVGKGAMALMSFAYPHKATDFGERVHPLPEDGSVPHMPGYRWIHTPGHTEGHVSLFRDQDRLLIAGDAFVTTKQESLYEVLQQKKGVHGPPAYFTPDWKSARASIADLAALQPHIAATGHGPTMQGEELSSGLAKLLRDFDAETVPDRGRYIPRDGTTE